MLRCQLTITAQGIDIEPIQKGGGQDLSGMPSSQSITQPKHLNAPAGYERDLNHHRFRIAREKAASDGKGGYNFPVALKGREEDLLSFCRELGQQFGVQEMVTEFSSGAGEIRFQYAGPGSPQIIENLAVKHRLLIAVCGTPVVWSGGPR